MFHSALLKYLPKRQAFSYMGMYARGQLAILEHNENIVKRCQASTREGMHQNVFVVLAASFLWSVLAKMFLFCVFFSPLFVSISGTLREKGVFCKRSQKWVMKKIYQPHTTNFRQTLLQIVFDRRRDESVIYKAPTSSLELPQPDLPPNIARVPRPSMEVLRAKSMSRL